MYCEGDWEKTGLMELLLYPRLQESLFANQRENLALEEKLENLVRPSAQKPCFASAPPWPSLAPLLLRLNLVLLVSHPLQVL